MRVTSDMVGYCDHRIRDFVLFSRLPPLLRLTQRHFPFDRSTGAQSLLYKIVRLLCLGALHGADTLCWHKWIYWPLDMGAWGWQEHFRA